MKAKKQKNESESLTIRLHTSDLKKLAVIAEVNYWSRNKVITIAVMDYLKAHPEKASSETSEK